MTYFLILTLCWVTAHIIGGIIRFGVFKDKPNLKHFVLIDLIGTYAMMWVLAGFAYLILLIVDV